MQISRRTKISISQLLSVINHPTVQVIFDKFGLEPNSVAFPVDLNIEIKSASDDAIIRIVA
jgi:hypothetical protein